MLYHLDILDICNIDNSDVIFQVDLVQFCGIPYHKNSGPNQPERKAAASQGVSPSTPPHEKMWHWYRCRENALVTSWETSLDAQTQNIKQLPVGIPPISLRKMVKVFFWIVSPEDSACPEKTEESRDNIGSSWEFNRGEWKLWRAFQPSKISNSWHFKHERSPHDWVAIGCLVF